MFVALIQTTYSIRCIFIPFSGSLRNMTFKFPIFVVHCYYTEAYICYLKDHKTHSLWDFFLRFLLCLT